MNHTQSKTKETSSRTVKPEEINHKLDCAT